MDIKKPDHLKDKEVEIDRRDASDHPGRAFALGVQEKMGKALCPPEFSYFATATVHIYQKQTRDLTGERTDTAMVHVLHGFQGVPEVIADAAFKELKTELMKQYGREAPKWRKT